MATIPETGDDIWDRIERAVEKVKDRLRRVSKALDDAGIPYAVIGGNAVQLYVAQVDEAAIRNTRDVDILLRRDDMPKVIEALGKLGFVHRVSSGITMFLDGPEAKARDAVHIVFSNEKVMADYAHTAPDVTNLTNIQNTWTLNLEDLVKMKLLAWRLKDRVHLVDMIEVGLIDSTWLDKIPADLRPRLQELLDSPEG